MPENKVNVDSINGIEFNLRDNADIVWLAMEASESKDSTGLKQYFMDKLNLDKDGPIKKD